MTASAVQVTRENASAAAKAHQDWQQKAASYYDLAGECHFPANAKGNALSQLRLFPAYRDANGEIKETDNARARELLDRVRDNSGGHAGILRNYGVLRFVIGEGYLTATFDEGTEVWEYLSPLEFDSTNEGRLRRKTGRYANREYLLDEGSPNEPLTTEGAARAYRFWNPHPFDSNAADSSVRAVLDLFEELKLLEMAVRARVLSRLAANGILFMPNELKPTPVDGQAPQDDPNNDPWATRFMEYQMRPIGDPGSAAAVVPFIHWGDSEFFDAVRHLKLTDANETYREKDLREECITRIAIGIDIPPEILKGMTEANHWSAWQIDEQMAKAHVFPDAAAFCEDFTSAYYRPACTAAGVDNAEQIIVWYDPADLVVHPDRSANAKDAYDRIEVSGEYFRDALGIPPDAKPDEEEWLRRAALELKDAGVALGLDDEPTAAAEDQTGADTEEQAPPLPPDPSEEEPPLTAAYARVMGAAEFALTRARAAAGSRARVKAGTCDECKAAIDGLPNHMVVARLSELGKIADLSLEPRELVRGAATEFSETLRRWGIGEGLATGLGSQVELYAARTLGEADPAPLPPGFADFLRRHREQMVA